MKIDTFSTIIKLSQPSATRADFAGLFESIGGQSGSPGGLDASAFAQMLMTLAGPSGPTSFPPGDAKAPVEITLSDQTPGAETLESIYALLGGLIGPVPSTATQQPTTQDSVPKQGMKLPIEQTGSAKQLSQSLLEGFNQAISNQAKPEANCNLPRPTDFDPPSNQVAVTPAPADAQPPSLPVPAPQPPNTTGSLPNVITQKLDIPVETESVQAPVPTSEAGEKAAGDLKTPHVANQLRLRSDHDITNSVTQATTQILPQQVESSTEASGGLLAAIQIVKSDEIESHTSADSTTYIESLHLAPADLAPGLPIPIHSVAHHLEQLVIEHLDRVHPEQPASVILRLDPPELGKVNVHLSMAHDDVVSIRMVTSDEAVRQTIERQLNELQQSLANHGVSWDQCQVECDSGRQSFERQTPLPNFADWQSIPFATRRPALVSGIVSRGSRGRVDFVA